MSKRQDTMRRIHYKRSYNMAIADYEFLLIIQDNRCACCGQQDNHPYKYFAIDHDHYSGDIRGLLCTRCNWLVGMAEHLNLVDKKLLEKVEKYLTGRTELCTIYT